MGRSITANDVLRKVGGDLQELERSLRLMDSLIAELQRFKVGNVLAIEDSNGEQLRLRLVALSPKSRPTPKLPG